MNKIDLVDKIKDVEIVRCGTRLISTVLKLTKKTADPIVDIFFDTIKEALLKGERVEIRGLGVFELRLRKARKGRNPKTGEIVSVPAKNVPFFKTSRAIKNLLNKERKI